MLSTFVSQFLDVDINQRAKRLGAFAVSSPTPVLNTNTSIEPAPFMIPIANAEGALDAWITELPVAEIPTARHLIVNETTLLTEEDVVNTVISNLGQETDVEITLPKATEGMMFEVVSITQVDNFLHIIPNAEDFIVSIDTMGGVGEYIGLEATDVGKVIRFMAVQTDTVENVPIYNWVAMPFTGAWSFEPAE